MNTRSNTRFTDNAISPDQIRVHRNIPDDLSGDDAELLRGVERSSGYLSEWSDNRVRIALTSDRGRSSEVVYDLSRIQLQCSGPRSIFHGLVPLSKFPNLLVSTKAYLNVLDDTFSCSTKKQSEITQNLNNFLRFVLWMIQSKGVYQLSALNRDDFRQFVFDFKKAGGWQKLLRVDHLLDELIDSVRTGTIQLSQICVQDTYRSIHIREGFIPDQIGIPIRGGDLPIQFYQALEGLITTRSIAPRRRQQDRGFSYMSLYSHIKSLNRLSQLPDVVDKPHFTPYPDGWKFAKAQSGYVYSRTSKVVRSNADGRTANLRLETAIKIFRESLAWIYQYREGVIAILSLYRNAVECIRTDYDLAKSLHKRRWLTQRIGHDRVLQACATALCQKHQLPFNRVVFDVQSPGRDILTCPCLEDLGRHLQTACFVQVAVNHGRRLNEVVGEDDLPYGLYFGCIQPDPNNRLVHLIDIYIEKSIKAWSHFYANRLVVDAVRALEELAQIYRPLESLPLDFEKDLAQARKQKLFKWRPITPNGFEALPRSYHYGASAPGFMKRAGVDNLTLDHRAHPYRRFFALLYFYRYDNAELLALSHHLRHLDPGMTKTYITDPETRARADEIQQLYNNRRVELVNERDPLNDVQSQMFADTIRDILSGDRTGGKWPHLVLALYRKLNETASFEELDLAGQTQLMAEKFGAEGYSRVSFEHGGCNVGSNTRTASCSNCIQDADGLPRLDQASPTVCHGCPHHDCGPTNLSLLRHRSRYLAEQENVETLPAVLRQEFREERLALNRCIQSEERLMRNNRKMLLTAMDELGKALAGESPTGSA